MPRKLSFIFLLLFIVSLFPFEGKAQEFYGLKVTTSKWAYSDRDTFLNGLVTKELLEELDSIYKKTPSTYEFVYSKEENKLKVFIHCSLDFYSIIDGKLIKEYRYMNRGYTCGPSVFFRDEAYHILGGQGFWLHHVDLLKFDSLLGSWELMQINNQPLDYFPRGSFHSKKGVTSIFGNYNNLRIPIQEKEDHGYFLDWEQKSWYPIKFETKGIDLAEIVNSNISYLYETQDYGFLISNSQLPSLGWRLWVIIEKERGKLFLHHGVNTFDMSESSYFETIGNKISYFDYEMGSATEGKNVVLDLDSLLKNSEEIGQITYLKEPKSSTYPQGIYVILLVLVLLTLGGWWMVKRKNKKVSNTSQSPLDEPKLSAAGDEVIQGLIHCLVHFDGERLTTETFDGLLGIDQILNFDSKRIKRSRLIKAMNANYKEKKGIELITRIKNPEDKRFVYYKIKF